MVAKPPNLFRFVFNRNRTHSLSVPWPEFLYCVRYALTRSPEADHLDLYPANAHAGIKDARKNVLSLSSAAMPDARRNSHYIIIICAHKVGIDKKYNEIVRAIPFTGPLPTPEDHSNTHK